MADSPKLPGDRAWVDANGKPLPIEFYRFLRDLARNVDATSGNTTELTSVLARLTALEAETDEIGTINALYSVAAYGNLTDGLILQLVNDSGAPGNTTYYGTGPDGVKGFFPVSATIAAGAAVVFTVAANGVTTVSLDATLVALAGANWAANSLPIGTGADTVSQVAFAANTFPARASTGNLVAKGITDGALSALAGTGGTTGVLRGDGTISSAVTQDWTASRHIGSGGALAHTGGLFDATSGGLYVQREGGASRLLLYTAGAVQAQLLGGRSSGTLAAPTATSAGVVFEFYATTYTGSAWTYPAAMQFNATEVHSAGAQGTEINFFTTNTGTASILARWQVTPPGHFRPAGDNLYDFGTSSLRVANDYVVIRNTSGAEYQTGEQAPSLTANTDNLALSVTARILRVSSNGAYNLTGLTGGAAGRRLTLLNASAFTITLTHDVTSTAANRFLCPNNASVLVRQNGGAELVYDATSSRWRVIGA